MAYALSIMDGENTGSVNMAADVRAMELVRSGRYQVVFRTYMWKPHCLSVGRFQDPRTEADVERLLSDGYHVVKRPTGGRAVWHGDELTYSIAAGTGHQMVSGSIDESLRKVAGILTEALNLSGVPAGINSSDRELASGRRHNPCFTSHGRSEIMTPDGRKLVGSAQARSRGVFIEHGSILFTNQQTMAAEYLPRGVHKENAERMKRILEQGVGTVREFNPSLTREDLAKILHSVFQSRIDGQVEIGERLILEE